MKKTNLLLTTLLVTLTFTACTKTEESPKPTPKEVSTEVTTAVLTEENTEPTRGFPRAKNPSDNVVCTNCYATFKLSRATQKLSHGHSYIECPICHKDYRKKAR